MRQHLTAEQIAENLLTPDGQGRAFKLLNLIRVLEDQPTRHALWTLLTRQDELLDTLGPKVLALPPNTRRDPAKAALLRKQQDPTLLLEEVQEILAKLSPDLREPLAQALHEVLKATRAHCRKEERERCAHVAMRLSRRRHLADDETGADAARQVAKFLREGDDLAEETP